MVILGIFGWIYVFTYTDRGFMSHPLLKNSMLGIPVMDGGPQWDDSSHFSHGKMFQPFVWTMALIPNLVMTFTVRHGKIHHAIKNGKPSMGHLYHGYVSHNQRVD